MDLPAAQVFYPFCSVKDPQLMSAVMESHREHLARSHADLRCRLATERQERMSRRKDATLNTALQANYLTTVSSKIRNILAGSTGNDLIGWKHINEFGEIDRRSRQHLTTASCPVVDVSKWVAESQCHLPSIQRESRTPRPAPSTPRARLRTNTIVQPAKKKRAGKALTSRVPRTSASTEALPSVSALTQKAVLQAELDFGMLSCGSTHIPLSAFMENGSEYSLELGTRRVFFFEFVNFLRKNACSDLSFEGFLQVVHIGVGPEEAAHATRKYSQRFAWAVGLSKPTAETVECLWECATRHHEGCFETLLSYERYVAMLNAQPFVQSTLDSNDMAKLFSMADEDCDGFLNKCEFAALFSGNVALTARKSPEIASSHSSLRNDSLLRQ